ncbi:CBS domain-containing protein [Streptomyces sp. NPDC047718]|uniref:CBS domain-containing protein n=1 Tax=Streptomyces sp. NPDC047718 TaxID=3155479 RepID=UPI0033F956B1
MPAVPSRRCADGDRQTLPVVASDHARILVDCGLFQGAADPRLRNRAGLPYAGRRGGLAPARRGAAMTATPYTVADVMTTRVVAVTPATGFRDIVAAMERWKVTALPVVEGEGRVVGVVSEADLLPKEEFHEHRPGLIEQMRRLGDTAKAGSTRAEDLMTSPAVTIRPDATLPRAARLMAERRVKRLPVVDADGTLRGIVSRADLLKVFLRSDEDLTAEIRRDVVERVFPLSHEAVEVTVSHGIATLAGRVQDPALIPLAERLARAVEGVVDVRCRLEAPSAP